MAKNIWFLLGGTALVTALTVALVPGAIAQTRPSTNNFQGRGVVQGAAFNQGRNANVDLILDRDNFGLEVVEIARSGSPIRVQYRGVVARRSTDPENARSFTLFGRVRSFTTSTNLRVLTNTTGTCRLEVFNARIISSNCDTVAENSSTRFLGVEQF